MNTTPLHAWPLKAFTLAKEKGWHPDGEDNNAPEMIGTRLAMIMCEIAEAIECVSRGQMKVAYVGMQAKPEGFPIELADVFLRLADFAYTSDVPFPTVVQVRRSNVPWYNPRVKAANLAHFMAGFGTKVCTAGCLTPGTLRAALECLFEFAALEGFDLLAMAELKHAYNTTRTLRHGGKIL